MTMLATMVKIIYVNSEGNGCECQLETKQKCSFLVHFNSPVIDTLLYSNKKTITINIINEVRKDI